MIEGILTLKRVPYGNKETPLKEREYRVLELATTAVGTIKEILDFIDERNLDIKTLEIRDRISGDAIISIKKFRLDKIKNNAEKLQQMGLLSGVEIIGGGE